MSAIFQGYSMDCKETGAAPDRRETLAAVNDFYAKTFDLLNDTITGSMWLANLAELVNCDRVTCVWWPAGRPEQYLAEFSGEAAELPGDWLAQADEYLEACGPQEAALFEELLGRNSIAGANCNCPDYSAEQVVACLSWHPARVVLMCSRSQAAAGQWGAADKELLKLVLPVIKRSVKTKSILSGLTDRLDLADKVFDCFPRGIFTVLTNRDIVARNMSAKELCAQGDILYDKDGKLQFADRALDKEFVEQLMVVREFPKNRTTDYGWYKSIGGRSSQPTVFLTMRAISHNTWRIESSPEESAVVITLGERELNVVPGADKLSALYGLTPAQARFANALLRHGSVEEAARSVNVSINTGRSHLRAIYVKANVDNLPQFFRSVSQALPAYSFAKEE